MQGIPRAVAVLLVACLIVHTQPVLRAAAQIDGVACLYGDRLRALIEAAALRAVRDLLIQKRLDLEVLVAGGGRQLDGCRLSVDDQSVIILSTSLAGGKVRGQHRPVHGQSLNGGVGVAPCAAQVRTVAAEREHDTDHIAVSQIAVLHGEGRKALVGEPVIQRAHPAGALASVKLAEIVDAGNIAAFHALAARVYGFQRSDHAGHHGAVGGQIDPCIHQRAVPRCSVLLGIGGVLHNDLHLAVVVGGFLHRHHSGLIGTLHRGDGGGGVDAIHASVIGGLRLIAQAVIQCLQAGEGLLPCGGHSLFTVGGHGLILRLGDHLHLERDGAAFHRVSGDNVLRQIVMVIRRLLVVRRDQRLRLHQVPRRAAVHRPHGPVFRVCGVQIVADKRMVARLGCAERRICPVGRGQRAVHIGRHHPLDIGQSEIGVAGIDCPLGQLVFVNVDRQRHLCQRRQALGVNLRHRVQTLGLIGGQQLLLIAVQSGVHRLNVLYQLLVVGVQVVQIVGQIGHVLPQTGDDRRVVIGRCAQLLQAGKVRVEGVHQARQLGGLVQVGRQGLVLGLEGLVVRRREVIVVEAVEIRLGLGGLFGAVLLQQRGGVVRLGHVDQGVVAAVQGIILADGGVLIHVGKGQVIRRHVEHGHGVPAGLGEHILHTAVRAGDGGGLVGGLGQGLRLGRVADEQRDPLGALALAQVGGVGARHGGGELRLVAHLQLAGRAHADQGDTVTVVFLVDNAAILYSCGIKAAGGLQLPHGR